MRITHLRLPCLAAAQREDISARVTASLGGAIEMSLFPQRLEPYSQ
jgi:ArsR family metal-binding transcriptional regulator